LGDLILKHKKRIIFGTLLFMVTAFLALSISTYQGCTDPKSETPGAPQQKSNVRREESYFQLVSTLLDTKNTKAPSPLLTKTYKALGSYDYWPHPSDKQRPLYYSEPRTLSLPF
jgi:hypothetical protein